MSTAVRWITYALAAGSLVQSINVDLTSPDSIKTATSTIAFDMLNGNYLGNLTGQPPGILIPPYFWWEAGGMFMHLVDYYYYTGDTSYNPATIQAITWQAGSDGSFMPPNQTKDEGNDDQVFWAFAAMTAAELKFPAPTQGYPSWAAMAQAVFNLQAERWDPTTCGGGLRWQINPLNNGYTYKNMPSNGGFFQLASRLARYTGNQTYVKWAEKSFNWIQNSVLYDDSDPTAIKVYDGTGDTANCTKANQAQYSYNYGILIGGLAYLYNHTEDQQWLAPIQGLLGGIQAVFFRDNDIIVEAGCEPESNCNTDGLSFKGFTLRWMTIAAQLVPTLADQIWPLVKSSAQGAAGQCDGGTDGEECGYHWTTSTWDGTTGVGQQMNALAAIGANMIPLENLFAPLTLATGATSKQNPSAGTGAGEGQVLKPITTADRAGAGILTFLILAFLFAGTYWLVAVETP